MNELIKHGQPIRRPTPWRDFFLAWRQLIVGGRAYTIMYAEQPQPLTTWRMCRFMAQSFRFGFILRFWRWSWRDAPAHEPSAKGEM